MSQWCSRHRLKCIVPPVAGLIVVAVWLLSPHPTDREMIVETITRGEHGIETKNVKEIMSCIAPDYEDSQNTTRTELLRMTMQWPRVQERGEVTVEDYHLDIAPPRATGVFEVTFVLVHGGGEQTVMPLTLTMQFVQERRGWRRVWLIKSVEGYSVDSLTEGVE